MIRKWCMLAVLITSVWQIQEVRADATAPAAVTRESLLESPGVPRLSVGADVDWIDLAIEYDSGDEATIEARSAAGYVGYDVLDWLTVFLTAGATEARPEGESDYGNARVKWSAGLNANIWRAEKTDRGQITQRLMWQTSAEFVQHNAEWEGTDVAWSTLVLAAPVSWEFVINERQFYSLKFYASPVVAMTQGEVDGDSGKEDFDGKDNFGGFGGVDFYHSEALSVGAEIQSLPESYGINIRYHF